MLQVFLVILLFVCGAVKLWFLNNINNAPKGSGKVKGNSMKKSVINKQFSVATFLDTAHGLGISMLASSLS